MSRAMTPAQRATKAKWDREYGAALRAGRLAREDRELRARGEYVYYRVRAVKAVNARLGWRKAGDGSEAAAHRHDLAVMAETMRLMHAAGFPVDLESIAKGRAA